MSILLGESEHPLKHVRRENRVYCCHYLHLYSLFIISSLTSVECYSKISNNPGYISNVINIPPLPSEHALYGGSIPVCYTNSPHVLSEWLDDNLSLKGSTVGFDLESVPNVPWLKRSFDGPATVQLATVDAALVLHLVDNNGIPSDSSAPILKEFLADKSFVKVGIGIDQDMLELYRLWGCSFDVHNRFDIGGIGSMDVRTTLSLKSLTKAVAKVELQKTRRLAMSNWSKVPLQIPQIAYAARDAWASAAILDQLAEKDPSKFSSQALIELILTDELSMKELDTRAKGRKLAKTKLQEILGKGPTKVSRQNLSEDQRIEVLTMEKVLRDLAPPPLYRIDLGSLGF